MAVGVYPGTFNPLTVAHLAIAEAALRQCRLERVDLVLSRNPLGKASDDLVALADRLAVLQAAAGARPGLGAAVTEARLVSEIARGYDAVVIGADKWEQITDAAWYGGDPAARDAAVAALPLVAWAPRAGSGPWAADSLPLGAVVLEVHLDHHAVSASEVRAGRHEWMAPEARAFAERTGAWIDPRRYGRPGAPRP